MPTPRKNETQDEWHSRCMSELVGEEGYEQDQANAICYSKWENRLKERAVRAIDRISDFILREERRRGRKEKEE